MELAVNAKSKKEVVSQFRQAEIITAARTVFAEKGYIAATVDEIAQHAALAKGTIYVYFDSKEQIYNAVMSDDLETLRRLTIEKIAAAFHSDRRRLFIKPLSSSVRMTLVKVPPHGGQVPDRLDANLQHQTDVTFAPDGVRGLELDCTCKLDVSRPTEE